jgi:hypothetical protein
MPSDLPNPDPPENEIDEALEAEPIDPKVEEFFSGAVGRIRHIMLAVTAVATISAAYIWGWRIALGVLLGCIVSYANFSWLERALTALADRITVAGSKVSSTGTVFRFLLRYAFIGVGAYVIFRGSPGSLYGFLGGLFLTVAAILCEAVYEVFAAFRSKI